MLRTTGFKRRGTRIQNFDHWYLEKEKWTYRTKIVLNVLYNMLPLSIFDGGPDKELKVQPLKSSCSSVEQSTFLVEQNMLIFMISFIWFHEKWTYPSD